MAYLKKEMLTTKPTLVVLALVAAVVISVGYIMALAILAPQQLAEATTAATDLVCSGCVGTSDIADSAVTSTKIGSGQVANSDIANDAVGSAKIAAGQVGNSDIASSAVTSTKIGSGQVANSDIATSAVTSSKISDTDGVRSVDIVNGQVTSADIASGAIPLNVHIVQGDSVETPAGGSVESTVNCDTGEILTGGGFNAHSTLIRIIKSFPVDDNTWIVTGFNEGSDVATLAPFALCVDPSLP